jgi:hypothetical protein
MSAFNAVTSAVFGTLLAPFGAQRAWSAWVDVLLWSLLGGILALLVIKRFSNQKAIARVKNEIKVHLFEVRLFQDDLLGVLVATGKVLGKNLIYVAHNMVPMVVMLVPMVAILAQLVATYAYEPLPPGSVQIVKASLDTDAAGQPLMRATDVRLETPPGVTLESQVRTPQGQIAWRLRLDQPGEHELRIHLGDEVVTKELRVGGPAGRMPVMRTKSWEGVLYPAEPGLPSSSKLASVQVSYPTRDLGWMPGGEAGILGVFFVLSIVAGLALKGVFKVTI